MRISDWSSDVCSSDLRERGEQGKREQAFDPHRASLVSAPMKTRRIIAWGALALIVLLAGGVALYAHLMTPKLQLGVGYGDRVACGCRYIEGRPLKSRSEEHTSELQSLLRN